MDAAPIDVAIGTIGAGRFGVSANARRGRWQDNYKYLVIERVSS
ncbi:hypothetical protein [Bradyrhizobium sp. 41S5]|nr:hypothetical protein [Bradyrhizobium sp. 41S5]